jgi:hypothetical protein
MASIKEELQAAKGAKAMVYQRFRQSFVRPKPLQL